MTLLYIYILWVAACVDSISADSLITVSARVGSTVVLPCNLRKEFTETPRVRWHIGKEFVFDRSSDGICIRSGYEGRVDVPEDELRKGNCSLVLKNVRITDDGFYKSSVVEHVERTNTDKTQEISRVELSVYEKPEERKEEPSTPSGEAGINWPRPLFLIISLFMCFLSSR